MADSVIVWAQKNDPPVTIVNVLCWQSYSNGEKITSIPRYLEQHSERLRAKYITFIYDLSQSNIAGKRILDHMDKGDGFSFWWMTLIAEKCNWDTSPYIVDAIRLYALEDWVNQRSIMG